MDIVTSTTLDIVWNTIISICSIFMFAKMNIDAWAAIIPLYGQWRLFDAIWGRGWLVLIPYVAALLLFPILADAILAVTYFMVFKGFGKSTFFAVLGAIFTPIAIIICAFDDSKFCG